jgi:hypothetical protein
MRVRVGGLPLSLVAIRSKRPVKSAAPYVEAVGHVAGVFAGFHALADLLNLIRLEFGSASELYAALFRCGDTGFRAFLDLTAS